MNAIALPKTWSRYTLYQSLVLYLALFAVLACFYWLTTGMGAPVNIMDYAAMLIILLLFGTLQWMVQKRTLAGLLAQVPKARAAGTPPPPTDGRDVDPEAHRNEQKRLFVHLFSVLQREGRLMDFLQEELSVYEDAQIGAAVRGIHESCNKALARYLSPQPIMKQAEGEQVEIPPGFDRSAVKLTGNVVGQPPFTGVLRHRGWQLQSIALPELSAADNPNLIAPAEVEIL